MRLQVHFSRVGFSALASPTGPAKNENAISKDSIRISIAPNPTAILQGTLSNATCPTASTNGESNKRCWLLGYRRTRAMPSPRNGKAPFISSNRQVPSAVMSLVAFASSTIATSERSDVLMGTIKEQNVASSSIFVISSTEQATKHRFVKSACHRLSFYVRHRASAASAGDVSDG